MSETFSVTKCTSLCGLGILLSLAFGSTSLAAGDQTSGSKEYRIEEAIGSKEYRISCLNCHGVGGKGGGPMAELLKKKPSDLTMLAKKNKGEYPFMRVYQTIDGRVVVPGHGDRKMPIWGKRYLEEDYQRYRTDFGGEDVVRGRILQLVYYVQTLQQ